MRTEDIIRCGADYATKMTVSGVYYVDLDLICVELLQRKVMTGNNMPGTLWQLNIPYGNSARQSLCFFARRATDREQDMVGISKGKFLDILYEHHPDDFDWFLWNPGILKGERL